MSRKREAPSPPPEDKPTKRQTVSLRNFPGNAAKDDEPKRLEVLWHDAQQLFDFLYEGDPQLAAGVRAVDHKALMQGNTVISRVDENQVLGSMMELDVLEHPRTDLLLVIAYWRVMGMCPYLLVSNKRGMFVRIVDPFTPDVKIEVTHGVHGKYAVLKSLPGYVNPITAESNKGRKPNDRGSIMTGDTEIYRELTRQPWMPIGFKPGRARNPIPPKMNDASLVPGERGVADPSQNEAEAQQQMNENEAAEHILDSGVFVWNNRPLPTAASGKRVISEVRTLMNMWHQLGAATQMHLDTQRSLTRWSYFTSEDEERYKAAGGRNMRGGVAGEQVSAADLMASTSRPERGGGYERTDPSELTEAEWSTVIGSHFTPGIQHQQQHQQHKPPASTLAFQPPHERKLDGRRILSTMAPSNILQLQYLQETYRAQVDVYTGRDNTGIAQTSTGALMQQDRVNSLVQHLQNAVAVFFEHAYERVYLDREVELLSQRIIKSGREAATAQEKRPFEENRLVQVQFKKGVAVELDTRTIIESVDMGAITPQEALDLQREHLGLLVSRESVGLELNRLVLPSEQHKQEMALRQKDMNLKHKLALEGKKLDLKQREIDAQPRLQDSTSNNNNNKHRKQ